MQYNVTHRTNVMNDLVTQIGVNGIIKLFSGAIPANCGTADTGTLIVTFAGNASQFGTVASGVLTASPIANATPVATLTPGYFRIYPGAGATTTNAVVQGTVGTSGTDMICGALTSGVPVAFGTFTDTAFGI